MKLSYYFAHHFRFESGVDSPTNKDHYLFIQFPTIGFEYYHSKITYPDDIVTEEKKEEYKVFRIKIGLILTTLNISFTIKDYVELRKVSN